MQHPSSDIGGTSVTTYLRKGKKCSAGAGITGVRNCERNTLQAPSKVSREGEAGGTAGTRPAADGTDHGEAAVAL